MCYRVSPQPGEWLTFYLMAEHTWNTNWALVARDALNYNKIFKLSTRDALNEKQIAGRHFYLINCDVTKNTISINGPQSGLHSYSQHVVCYFHFIAYYSVLYLRSVAFLWFLYLFYVQSFCRIFLLFLAYLVVSVSYTHLTLPTKA